MITLAGSLQSDDGWLFRDIELTLEDGRWSCLLGPSGSGKTTLLRLLAGLEVHGSFRGAVTASDGKPVAERIAYMAQDDLLLPWLDVTDNVALGARLRGETVDRNRAHDLIERVGLAGHADKRPTELSGGMRQRVALARTLMEDSPFVLLDEPFSALDARTRADMQELAFDLFAGRLVLLVTHDPAEAARLGHRITLIDERGLTDVPVVETPPLRNWDDAETLELQARLVTQLRRPVAA